LLLTFYFILIKTNYKKYYNLDKMEDNELVEKPLANLIGYTEF